MLSERDNVFHQAIEHSAFLSLDAKTQNFLKTKALAYRLSFSQIQNLIVMAIDFQIWDEGTLEKHWVDKETKKEALKALQGIYERLKNTLPLYPKISQPHSHHSSSTIAYINKETLGLGNCPVASPKTRCCNLLTLDAVESCGFDCSYCSIQSFYHNHTISFDKNFATKLASLNLDPNQTYHIGTGQSSDSLMWGNHAGILEALITFAHKNPNVILEFKSKSDNIAYLLEHDIPRNIMCTWSLNPQVIIDHEEHRSSSLEKRIQSARALADKGVLVGFHFHPIVLFEGWEEAYHNISETLQEYFKPEEVALVSMGTLTFIKPVLKKIRQRAKKSKILQMPLIDTNGKYSYPYALKEQMFSWLYNTFKPWHKKVFFYLCMEEISLWNKVFGYEYDSNETFEKAMKSAYKHKMELR